MSLSGTGSSFSKREVVILIIAVAAIAVAAWLFYARSQPAAPKAEEVAAEKVAVDVAKAENPFKSDNPLSGVETNPFDKTKKVLNPF